MAVTLCYVGHEGTDEQGHVVGVENVKTETKREKVKKATTATDMIIQADSKRGSCLLHFFVSSSILSRSLYLTHTHTHTHTHTRAFEAITNFNVVFTSNLFTSSFY